MVSQKKLCFVALLPPEAVQAKANAIKDHFAAVYESSHAKKSPPHITLQPPFKWESEQLPDLKTTLGQFAQRQRPVPVHLSGFGAFPPRVIYIHVEKTPELLTIQQSLMGDLKDQLGLVDPVAQSRPFVPHLTVAFRDLSKSNFRQAWKVYQDQPFDYQFTVQALTLLLHNGKHWEIEDSFALAEGSLND